MCPEHGIIGVTITRESDVSPYTGKHTARMSQQSDSPFHSSFSNSESLHFLPMSSCQSIHSTRSYANLEQRLLQLTCIILHPLMRLINSPKTSIRYPRAISLNKLRSTLWHWHTMSKGAAKGISYSMGDRCHHRSPLPCPASKAPSLKPLPP